jgi:hypothetical protein
MWWKLHIIKTWHAFLWNKNIQCNYEKYISQHSLKYSVIWKWTAVVGWKTKGKIRKWTAVVGWKTKGKIRGCESNHLRCLHRWQERKKEKWNVIGGNGFISSLIRNLENRPLIWHSHTEWMKKKTLPKICISYRRNSLLSIEHTGLLLCSQQPVTRPYL